MVSQASDGDENEKQGYREMARRNMTSDKGTSTLIHKIILGIFATLDIGAIVMLLTHDVTKIASRRGIAIDGTLIAFAVAYCLALAAIHVIGIFRVASASDPRKAAELRESRLTGMGEMLLFTGLLMVLVAILLTGPGMAVWVILLAMLMVVVGGVLIAIGINRTVLKAALVVLSPRRRRAAQGGRQAQGPQE